MSIVQLKRKPDSAIAEIGLSKDNAFGDAKKTNIENACKNQPCHGWKVIKVAYAFRVSNSHARLICELQRYGGAS